MSTDELQAVLKRLQALEDGRQVSVCMHTYMRLCDDLNEQTNLQSLLALFTDGAIWEGVGEYYRKRLGRYCGISEIEAMFARYTRPPAHFSFNLHILGNEKIVVKGDRAEGEWVLVQPSDFTEGGSHLNAALITADFCKEQQDWKISHFRTRNLFSRTVARRWQEGEAVPVPSQDP